MKSKTKRHSLPTRPVVQLVLALIILLPGESAARASGENDSSLRARPATPPTAVTTARGRRGQHRLAEERALVNSVAVRRDPFEVPPPPKADGGGDDMAGRLPPGVRGLVIGQLRLEGIVRDEESGSMIAVVTNRSNLAYFLRLHEEVYNGVVSRITADAIYFQQIPVDSVGRTEARRVVLRLESGPKEAR